VAPPHSPSSRSRTTGHRSGRARSTRSSSTLDLKVADLDAGEAAVVALGARKHEVQPGETFRVFLDPAGHPFCLVLL
jgi:hypothetical protein